MPVIRIMNWNIEQLSRAKIGMGGGSMATAIARIIVDSQADIVLICELKLVQADVTLNNITTAINNQLGAAGNFYWLKSQITGCEYYGFIIRDINTIRPLTFAANPHAPDTPDGTEDNPLIDLFKVRWSTWPAAFPAAAPAPLPAKPLLGVTDIFASPVYSRSKKQRMSMGGQALARGGYSLGRGFRLPCLAMFAVRAAAGQPTILPVLVCHYAAVRSGRNFLAQQQADQLHLLHLAQLFNSQPDGYPAPPRAQGYLDIDNAAVPVANILYTGDFNINFLENRTGAGASNVAKTNRKALDSLTPTSQGGGSAAPAAAAGAPVAVPAVPYNFANWPDAPVYKDVAKQQLRASCTVAGTMLHHYHAGVVPPDAAALRGAAFDYFLYGGAVPNTAALTANESGQIYDIPTQVGHQGSAAPALDLGAIRNSYNLLGTKDAAVAGNLSVAGPGAPALSMNDRLIGARLVSDHLPVVLQMVCP